MLKQEQRFHGIGLLRAQVSSDSSTIEAGKALPRDTGRARKRGRGDAQHARSCATSWQLGAFSRPFRSRKAAPLPRSAPLVLPHSQPQVVPEGAVTAAPSGHERCGENVASAT